MQLFVVLLEKSYFEEDLEVLKLFVKENEIKSIMFFIPEKGKKMKQAYLKAFEKLDIEFEDYDENTVLDTISEFVEDEEIEDYQVVYSGIEDVDYVLDSLNKVNIETL